jgi:glycosyltransferase involved in cell wall biosynthesis
VVADTLVFLAEAGHAVGLVHHDPQCPPRPEVLGVLGRTGGADVVLRAVECFKPDVVQVHFLETPELLRDIRKAAPTCVFLHDQTWFCPSGDRSLRAFKPCHRPFSAMCLAYNYLSGCGGKRPSGNLQRWFRTRSLMVLRDLPAVRMQVASDFMRTGLAENGFDLRRVDMVALYGATPPADAGPPDSGTLLVASRLTWAKGIHVAIEAMSLLRDLDCRLVIAGDGGVRAALENLAARLALGDRVRFLGEIDPVELDRWYSRARVVLFPVLRAEPFGMVGVEALAHGRPIVAFVGGAVSEWLWPGETGVAVDDRNPAGLARAVRGLLADPARCDALGAAARRRWEKFRPEAYLGRLLESFGRTINGPPV